MKKFYVNRIPPHLSGQDEIVILRRSNDVYNLLRELDVKMSYRFINAKVINAFRMHEALESTRIEGTQTTMREVFEARVNRKESVDVREVDNYLNALDLGKAMVQSDRFIASRTIKAIHKALLSGDVRGANCDPGEFRRIDNLWLGTKESTRKPASYVPPSNIEIADLMKNLEEFMNTNQAFNPIIIAAIAHAQFESIHPFLDGNGRVGRMLIPMIFELKGDTTLANLFISKQLESNKYKYYGLLNGTRKENAEWFDWILFFIDSIETSIKEAIIKYDAILSLYKKHQNKQSLSHTKVLDAIFTNPVTTISDLVKETGLTRPTISKVLSEMMENKLVYKSDDVRNVKYFCYDLLNVM